MATLYEIEQAIMDCVDLETGEIIDIEKLDQLQMDREVKIENTALCIKNLLSDADQIREEEKKLADRRRVCENKAKSLKEYLSGFLGGEKFKTPRVAISYRKSKSVDVQDITALPKEYLKYSEPTANKTEIKKAIEAGTAVPGCVLVENSNIQIK